MHSLLKEILFQLKEIQSLFSNKRFEFKVERDEWSNFFIKFTIMKAGKIFGYFDFSCEGGEFKYLDVRSGVKVIRAETIIFFEDVRFWKVFELLVEKKDLSTIEDELDFPQKNDRIVEHRTGFDRTTGWPWGRPFGQI